MKRRRLPPSIIRPCEKLLKGGQTPSPRIVVFSNLMLLELLKAGSRFLAALEMTLSVSK